MSSLVFCFLSVCAFRGVALDGDCREGEDIHFQCYQAKVSIFRDLLLHL